MNFIIAISLDALVIFILVFSLFRGRKKGFVKTAYSLVSWILSLLAAWKLFPLVGKGLRALGLFGKLQGYIAGHLSLGDLSGTAEAAAAIQNLPIPKILQEKLIENNNYEVYHIFNVDTLSDYVAGYLANVALNIIAMAVTFLLVFLLIRLIGFALEIVAKLPVLRTLNSALGMAAGVVMGVVKVWAVCIILTIIGMIPKFTVLLSGVSASVVTQFFYTHNLIMDMVLRIFG